ncbi:separin protein [Coemansia sp. RSA 2050]|nr:separin protein [Coemansia sp. RSA 2050]
MSGTNLAQDQRFGDAAQKLISQTTFSSVLKKRIDMSKVNLEIIKPWISRKIHELLGIEDEVLFEYVVNMLQESNTPDGKAMQVNLTGFLESKTVEFMQSLWTILLEAQKGPGGVPESLVREKVEEAKLQRAEQKKIRDRIRSADERRANEIRKETMGKATTTLEGVERMLRIVVSAFRFLHSNRSAAGFPVLALEKTMSNFGTACANAHLGLRAWDCLAFLRQCLLEHAETHTVVAATAKTGGRAVRQLARSGKKQAVDRLSSGMRRLSLVRDSAGGLEHSVVHFPMSYGRGDASFDVLVVTLLSNVLRVLAQVPTATQALELMPQLGVRCGSALEWCLRLRDVDSTAAEPFLGACFRAYYGLGANGGRHSLDIRLLGLAAYASTKACDARELLKYAARACAHTEPVAAVAHGDVAAFCSGVVELARPLGGVSPEMVDFYYRWALACLGADDLPGALSVCGQIALRNAAADAHSELVACALACNCHVQSMLASAQTSNDALPTAERMSGLAEQVLGRSARHTLSGWNALAMCADISRKTAKRAVAELREPRLGPLQSNVSGAVVLMLDAADRIYEAYTSRGAALKAQEAGGSSVTALRSSNAEVCVLAVQLAVQYREHDTEAAARHSDRLLLLCGEPGCSPDFLRSHSTVFFNRGASLYQLKSFGLAALAMERAIESLTLWATLNGTGDVFAQLCKRYEIAALAHQADGAFHRASLVLGRAVKWIASLDATLDAVASRVPVGSSLAASGGEIERLLMFVDRYVRMCAARLALDSSEPQARASLLDYVADTEPMISDVLRAWVYEAEAFLWRPFAVPFATYALDMRAARLECAIDLYKKRQCSWGSRRCLVELAKIDRDRGNVDQCVDRLGQAAVTGDPPCMYELSVEAERHAWLAIVAVERDNQSESAKHLLQCRRLWARVSQAAEASGTLDTGHLLGVTASTMGHVADLLLSRRMYAAALDVLRSRLDIASLCEPHDRTSACAPLVMLTLVDLGTASLLLGQTATAAQYFSDAAGRYEPGVVPAHVEIASKIAFSLFCLAGGDEVEGARAMSDAGVLARSVLGVESAQRSARTKRLVVSPENMVLFSKASLAYSVLSLRRGALADAVDFGLHSYRILHSLLRSLGAAHARAKREEADRLNTKAEVIDDDPFAKEEEDDRGDEYWQYIAFGGNWELQRLLVDNLAQLSELYSLRGSVREAEYFLHKGLDVSAQLNAPHQEAFLRLREADILARKYMWDECALSLAKARELAVGELEHFHVLVVEGDSLRRRHKYMEADLAYGRAQDVLSRVDAGDVPLLLLSEDLAVRRRLLSRLTDIDDCGPAVGGELARRCIDQRPDHLLMQAHVAFAELQRLLALEPAWASVLQSALVFPALRRSSKQQPRRGSTKALIRECLGELDSLLVAAAESAITVGFAHCVHESCHLLALTRALSTVFGLSSGESGVLAKIVDDARNITAVREAVDAIRRKQHSVPASLGRWPADALEFGKDKGCGLDYSPSSSPSLLPRRGLGQMGELLSSPSTQRQRPRPLAFDPLAIDNVDVAPAVDFFGLAADGAKVVAGWTASDNHSLLRDRLPASWVACSISIDTRRSVMFVTRYERNCDPLVVCLPMREIELDKGSSGEGVFGDLQSKLAAIIAESDLSMKTGGSCTTEDEKRRWWDLRSGLDRRLGELLGWVESEWLGGFKGVLRPDARLLDVGECAAGGLDIEALRGDIQGCVVGCLSKAFAAKAKSLEVSDNLCLLVLNAVARSKGDGDDGEWLDVCSMIWDVYCYQGAAPANPGEDLLSALADSLRRTVAGYAGCVSSHMAKTIIRKQLVLILDKHAQQVPWECLPCLRDYPISRVPSVAFLLNGIAAASANAAASATSILALARTARPPRVGSGLINMLDDAGPMLAGLGDESPMPLLGRATGRGTGKRIQQPARKLVPSFQPLFDLDQVPNGASRGPTEVPSGAARADGSRVFYVLNPEGDLHRTQANFEGYLKHSRQRNWHGVIGRRPSPHECESGLLSSGIFMYFGHGGAENYISRAQIRGLLPKCSVALLFGCSSGLLRPMGEYDAMGTAVDYLIAGCPALVGNLWDVGDKDIDRFAARLLAAWGLDRMSAEEIAVKPRSETNRPVSEEPLSLAEAVCEARKACRMSFLTGAAPVVYGIPVYLA